MQASDGTDHAPLQVRPQHLSEVSFESLPLHASLKSSLAAMGYTHCTPIQAATLPLALQGQDLAGQAQTGTGKTAAFLLAVMNLLLTQASVGEDGQPRAYIVAPTRELAIQIYNDALQLGAQTGLRMVVVYGGTGYETQKQTLAAGVDILIGTPGRLIDYFKQGLYVLKGVEVLVLDEADR